MWLQCGNRVHGVYALRDLVQKLEEVIKNIDQQSVKVCLKNNMLNIKLVFDSLTRKQAFLIVSQRL